MQSISLKCPIFAIQEQSEGEDKRVCIGVFPIRGMWSDIFAIQLDDIEKGINKFFPGYDHQGEGGFRNESIDGDLPESSFYLEGSENDNEWDDIEFSEITPLQGTGILDKHVNEIYNGDIIIFDNILPRRNTPFVVQYIKGMFCIENPILNFEYCPLAFIVDSPHVEIIGNIYENPELLSNQ